MPIALPLALVFAGLPHLLDGPESFEDLAAGGMRQAVCRHGTLEALEGHAAIDDAHGKTGKQCLHILGGSRRRVHLALGGGMRAVGELRFHAERWTSRAPFEFSVEVHAEDGWRELDLGPGGIRVGARFLSSVRIPVEDRIDQVRLTCTSPKGTGVLIDDLEIVDSAPVAIGSVEFQRPMLPVLPRHRWNPVGRIDLEITGTQGEIQLQSAVIQIESGAGGGAIRDLALFAGPASLDYRDPAASLSEATRLPFRGRFEAGAMVLEGGHGLPSGMNHVWVGASFDSHIDLDGRVHAICRHVTVGEETHTPQDQMPIRSQRYGVALRSKGDGGSAAFRIPGLVTTESGTLIAIYDVRWRGWGDLPGDIDVGMSRSTDGGRTWEPQRIIMDMGDDEEWSYDGIGDPSILVDRTTGDILVVATWSHGNRAWRGSAPGIAPEDTGQLMLVRSQDDGVTWSQPRNITPQVKDPAWCYILQGPGRGITMGDGTLVFPAQFQDSPEKGRMPHSTVIVSRDKGETWAVGTGARANTTESAVVELDRGELMLNMRDNRGAWRSVSTSRDGGKTWAEHPTSRKALMDPVCMGSLIHVGRELSGKADGRLLFSNPSVPKGPRRQMSIRASSDFGATWGDMPLLLDEGASAGYSCLTMVDDETVGILYEGSRAHMTFQRIPLGELFPDSAPAKK